MSTDSFQSTLVEELQEKLTADQNIRAVVLEEFPAEKIHIEMFNAQVRGEGWWEFRLMSMMHVTSGPFTDVD